MTWSPLVISATPFTTIQCSARWWCICKLRLAPGLTWIRLTLNPSPSSTLSYQPHGRATLRCKFLVSRFCSSSMATIFFTSWLFDRSATNTASAVSITIMFSSPTALTNRPLEWIKEFFVSVNSVSPDLTFPSASRSPACQTASQAPKSFQPAFNSTIWIGKCDPGHFSMTA